MNWLRSFFVALAVMLAPTLASAQATIATMGYQAGANPRNLCVFDLSAARPCVTIGAVDDVAHTFTIPVGSLSPGGLWPLSGPALSNGLGSTPCETQFGNSFTYLELCMKNTAAHPAGTLSALSVIDNFTTGTAGQPYADYAAQFSTTKKDYLTSTQVGEIGNVQLTAWQNNKDDVSGLEASIYKVRGGTGDYGGVLALGDLVASWLNPAGNPTWEVHTLLSFGEDAAGPTSGAGYGVWTEPWIGVPYTAFMASTFNGHSGSPGTYGWRNVLVAWHDRSTANAYFKIAGDLPSSGSLSPGDMTQGYPGFSVTSHTDASGNWCLLDTGLDACHIAISAAFVSAVTIYHPTAIDPPIGNNVGLVINQTPTGSTGVTYWNQINMSGDTSPCAFCVDFYDQHALGGASVRGAKAGFTALLYQTTVNTGSGATAIVGLEGIGSSNVGDGGTGLTNSLVQGTYFGQNVIARNDGTNVQEVVASEADTMTSNIAGGGVRNSSARYTFGYTAANYEAVQGATLDAAYAVYSGGSIGADHGGGPWGPGVGFHCGLCFAELSANTLVPLDSTATVLGTHLESLSNIPVAYGIDLRGFSISTSAFASTGFVVSGAGAVTATLPTSAGASGLYVCVDTAGVFYKKASCP